MSNLAIDRFGRIVCDLQITEQKIIANGKKKKIHAIFCLLISDQKLCAKTENSCRLIATINRIRRVCSSKIVRLATMIESQNSN
jgi:hypothetical protein